MSTGMLTPCRHYRRAAPHTRRYTGGMALRIRELREQRGLTQQMLAEMAGISRSQLSEIENERKPANTVRLAAIAKALGQEVEDLFSQDDAESYRRVILDLMKSMHPDDRLAVIRHAQALASRQQQNG